MNKRPVTRIEQLTMDLQHIAKQQRFGSVNWERIAIALYTRGYRHEDNGRQHPARLETDKRSD